MTERCDICKKLLDQPSDPTSLSCGGTCRQCMAEAGDPGCVETMRELGLPFDEREALALASRAYVLLEQHHPELFQEERWAHARWDKVPESTDPRVERITIPVIDNDVGKTLNIYVANRRGPILAALRQMHERGPWILFPFGSARAILSPLKSAHDDNPEGI